MDLPREKLLLFIAGYFIDKTKDMVDMIIHMDNFLIGENVPPMTQIERDVMNQIYDEVWLMMKQNQINRKDIRAMWNKQGKNHG